MVSSHIQDDSDLKAATAPALQDDSDQMAATAPTLLLPRQRNEEEVISQNISKEKGITYLHHLVQPQHSNHQICQEHHQALHAPGLVNLPLQQLAKQ